MAIKISGTTVINDSRELSTGLTSAWDTVTVTASGKTLVNREHCTVTAATQTITLPATPSVGWEVVIAVGDFTDTVVGRNGSNIMGLAEDLTLDSAYAVMNFIYTGASQGWRIY